LAGGTVLEYVEDDRGKVELLDAGRILDDECELDGKVVAF